MGVSGQEAGGNSRVGTLDTDQPKDGMFDTAHLQKDLGQRSVRGAAATLFGQFTRFALQLGSTAALARLLTPADFGLIAMITAVTGLLGQFKDMGLTMATVQKRTVTHAQASTLFWINGVLSILLALICVALAPAVAAFYKEPSLTAIMAVISITFIFNGLAAQHLALLRRQMRFSAIAVIEVLGMAFGILCALALAWAGAGYWALVALPVGEQVSKGIMTLSVSGWWPGPPRRNSGVRSMFTYGLNVGGFSLMTYIGRNADDVLIGRFLGSTATGLYTKAYALLMLPINQVNAPINAVAVPTLSRLQDDPDRYCDFYYRAVRIIAYLTGPLIVLLAVTADDLIPFLLGDQWTGAVPIFHYLAIASIFQPILYTAGWVWLSLGRARRLFLWSLFATPAFVASFVVGLPWGPEGVALSYAICVNALTPLGLKFAYMSTDLSLRRTVKTVARPYGLTLWILVSALAARQLTGDVAVFTSLVTTIAIAGASAAILAALHGGIRGDFRDIMTLIRKTRS